MSDVTVGVKRLARDGVADVDHPAVAEFGVFWVKIGDTVLTAEDHGVLTLTYEASGSAVSTVTLTLRASSFTTVEKDQPR